MLLCSPARNPDGSFVQPSIYAINEAQSERLAVFTLAILTVGIILAIAQSRRSFARPSKWCAGIGAALMALHPLWTVPTNGGDCGILQVEFSWIVLGLQGVLVGLQLVFLLWRRDAANQNREDYAD
jgi:uncharacterized membrane protein YedE/YeeE